MPRTSAGRELAAGPRTGRLTATACRPAQARPPAPAPRSGWERGTSRRSPRQARTRQSARTRRCANRGRGTRRSQQQQQWQQLAPGSGPAAGLCSRSGRPPRRPRSSRLAGYRHLRRRAKAPAGDRQPAFARAGPAAAWRRPGSTPWHGQPASCWLGWSQHRAEPVHWRQGHRVHGARRGPGLCTAL